MKREIKFRGLRVDGGGWVEGDLRNAYNGIYINPQKTIANDRWLPVHPETVGQYTGLKDENGKEIWEGDKISDGATDCVIKWHNGCWAAFEVGNDNWMDLFNLSHEYPIFLIGNIHE